MEKLVLKQKAFEIDFGRIKEGFLWGQHISYAATKGKAKMELLTEVEGALCEFTGDEITYLNIPVIRCKEADKYEFEGENVTLHRIEEIHRERKRLYKLDSILNDPKIVYAYIQKGSYYRPGSCGYTDFRHRAGVYTKEEAVSSAKSCRDIWVRVIDIDEHNEMINKEIKELESRLLKN